MTSSKPFILALCTALLGTSASAADFSDPSWPYIQRKVERLSVGLMWPEPIPETELDPDLADDVADLAGTLALRRVTLEDAKAAVEEFAADHGKDPALMGQVFQAVFDRMSQRRRQIISGIEDYSLGQIALTERIEETRVKMTTLMDADAPDYDQVDALEEQLDWDERIYTDRQKALTYVCESPVLLEQRLYALAEILQAAGSDG